MYTSVLAFLRVPWVFMGTDSCASVPEKGIAEVGVGMTWDEGHAVLLGEEQETRYRRKGDTDSKPHN